MSAYAFIPFLLTAACFLAWPASAKDVSRHVQTSQNEFEATVYVVQSCQTPDIVEKVAQATVSGLFARIDVSVRFVHSEPPQNDADAIVLRLVDHAPGSAGPYVLGSAWIYAKPRRLAYVYCDRVLAFYDGPNWRENGRILGYAIAHELGHILQAEPGHSPAGIMRAYWKRRDVVPMLQGTVTFLPADAQRIREAMADRRTMLALAGKN